MLVQNLLAWLGRLVISERLIEWALTISAIIGGLCALGYAFYQARKPRW